MNGRRHCRAISPTAPPQPDLDPHGVSPGDALWGTVELRLPGVVLDEAGLAGSPMLPYVRMIVSLIEGIELSCGEVVRLLRQAMRQHSIGARRRIDYLLSFLHRHPP